MQMVASAPREPLEPVPSPPPGFKRPLSAPLNPVLEYITEEQGTVTGRSLEELQKFPYRYCGNEIYEFRFLRVFD